MSYNNVASMDISRNTKLTSLTCDNNILTGLDISNNTSITSLKCTKNKISTIYVWDIDYAEGNSRFRKDASAKWAIHNTLSNSNNKFLQCSIYPIPSNRYIFIDTESKSTCIATNKNRSNRFRGFNDGFSFTKRNKSASNFNNF